MDKEVDPKGHVTKPENYHVPVDKLLKSALEKKLHSVTIVGIDDGGAEYVASSEGTPIALNMLANGIKFIENEATLD